MKIEKFAVEEWMNDYETKAKYNIAETCVDSVSLNELAALTNTDASAFLKEFADRRLTYGDILGAPLFKEGIARLYKTLSPQDILTTHGAAGANHLVFYSLIEPGDHVISVMPTYQQLYSIPESFGANVDILRLKEEDGYIPNLTELKKLMRPDTKMICINNPNNPTGALIPNNVLREIGAVAADSGAYVLCDEVYRFLNQEDTYQESIADVYDKGISVSSMSKIFSLAGVRLGWIASRDPKVIEECITHRDYNMISCGMFDEAAASLALKDPDKLLERSRAIVRRNLRVLDEWVGSEPHFHYHKPDGGTTTLLFYDMPIDSYEFCRRLLVETGVLLTPGACFGSERCVRIGYACDTEELKAGLERLGDFARHIEMTPD